MSAKKDINKSIRITQHMYDYIMSHDGDGFNAKLECMINKFERGEASLDRRLQSLTEELDRLDRHIMDRYRIISNLDIVRDYINYAYNHIKGDLPVDD